MGSFVIYRDVEETGCDPSESVPNQLDCKVTGADVFGAMLAVLFAGQGLSQLNNYLEAFMDARLAAGAALTAIDRKLGADEHIVYKEEEVRKSDSGKSNDGETERSGNHAKAQAQVESVIEKPDDNNSENIKGDLTKYLIDTSSDEGLKPDSVEGNIIFRSVDFFYPTMAKEKVESVIEKPDDNNSENIKGVLPKYLIDASSDEGLKLDSVEGNINFRSVDFFYPTRPEEKVLNDFSFDITAGSTVAFVGPSGSGKSTVVALLERFYDPVAGSVLLDGNDIKDINLKCLRHFIGYVGQEPTLFNASIADNIKYGNPSATQAEIEEAARLCNAHSFITSFPDGYRTRVADGGSQLSGGQKQRIAIARCLVANPSILLLDEATSALDNESELLVQQAIDNVLALRKRTTIIIAHRLSTIRNADVIAVVEEGKIVESGTHEKLMTVEDGYYCSLVSKQEGGEREPNQKSPPKRTLSTESRRTINDSSVERDGDDYLLLKSKENHHHEESAEAPLMEFRDVKFSYPARSQKMILNDFNLCVHAGETLALVGPSGGGKSTVVSLIERFYDPQNGSLLYSGHDIKSLNVGWYRDLIGYVGQEPTLFNESIATNIAYGANAASKEEIESAACAANADQFIRSFPDGYDTTVGERGSQVSGGQKQRIAIARALIKKPKLLLLDEATSALDNQSEEIVQEVSLLFFQ
jgi:ATP-binding cassette subfamily B (MDR/TAP) protein 1